MQAFSSPFKFLDSYTKDDKEIFFGRDNEIEKLYHCFFDSKLMLVYGISGTGKSSLINCGLANKFNETDWLPLFIRRGSNILESTSDCIKSASITKQKYKFSSPTDFKKGLRSLYLDHYKPVCFIFDQFEELFIFGDEKERTEFIQIVKLLIDSDLQCRFIFIIREEYIAGITEFEKVIPSIFSNRVRIEKMAYSNALEVINGPCKQFHIDLEDGFTEALLGKLFPGNSDIELTYLQVSLDKIFKLSLHYSDSNDTQSQLVFTHKLLDELGNVSDLLGDFLDEQIGFLQDPASAISVLKSFVSLKGTRKQLTEEEILVFVRTFGSNLSDETLREYLLKFVNLRILKEKSDNGIYELRHDALAEKIFSKISMMEKELLEVISFLDTALKQYAKRGVFLSQADLKYIQYFDDKQIFRNNKNYSNLIESSKKHQSKQKRKKRQAIYIATISIIVVLSTLSIWAITQRTIAISQKNIAEIQKNEALNAKKEAQKAKEEADVQKTNAILSEKIANQEKVKALNAKLIAEEELYRSIKSTLTISSENLNIVYYGIKNPIAISVSGIPNDKLKVFASNGYLTKMDEKYYVEPNKLKDDVYKNGYWENTIWYDEIITVCTINKEGNLDTIGSKKFRVNAVPGPVAYYAGKAGGLIPRATAAAQTGVFTMRPGMAFDYKPYVITSFVIAVKRDSIIIKEASSNQYLTDKQKQLMSNLKRGDSFSILEIFATCSDSSSTSLPGIHFIVN